MQIEVTTMPPEVPPSRVGKVQVAVWITPEMRQELKIALIEEGSNLQALTTDLYAEWLRNRKRKGSKK